MAREDLTQSEIHYLPEVFNLTDGHAHRKADENEQRIIDKMSKLFDEVDREQQVEIEKEYVSIFYELTQQTIDTQRTDYFLLPSASISLEIIANFLRLRGLDLALIEPCFDNLANIFKRHNIELTPFPDTHLASDDLEQFLSTIRSKAICIVSPNNPTGIHCSKRNFEALVRFCKQHNKLLILDASFRVYLSKDDIFDEYLILQQSGIDYIVVEDSGKTWPTKEIKVSILAVSHNIFQPVYDVYSDFIYHHSPFGIKMVGEFVRNSMRDNLQGVHGVVADNRRVLDEAIRGTCLVSAGEDFVSVAWLRVEGTTAYELESLLTKNGIFVLPGNEFYWSHKSEGATFIRIALVRDRKLFKAASRRLRVVLLGTGQADPASHQ